VDLKQLEYFVRIAELGSFSKAALVLRIAQPALSRQVRQLEVELRETLLESSSSSRGRARISARSATGQSGASSSGCRRRSEGD